MEANNKQPGGKKSLNIGDLGVVLNELYPARGKWFNLGLQLGVPVADLQKIESEYKNDHGTCLRQMLIKWLESGKGSWESLCQGLASPMVQGDDHSLVARLREKYCKGGERKGEKRMACEKELTGPDQTTAKVRR